MSNAEFTYGYRSMDNNLWVNWVFLVVSIFIIVNKKLNNAFKLKIEII